MIHFIQPRALNRYVDDSIPLTWQRRWQACRMSIPLILFCCAIYAPIQLAIMWLEQSWDGFVRILVPFLIFPIAFLLLFEFLIRIQQQSRRSLKIKNDRLIFPFDRHLSWASFTQVQAFRLEPIPAAPDLNIVRIDLQSSRRNRSRNWRMVLPLTEINSVLLPELNRRKRDEHHTFSIIFATEPSPKQPRPKIPQPWFFALGAALLIYSLPLFMILMTPDRPNRRDRPVTEHPQSKFTLTTEAKECLGVQLSRHFDSFEQLRAFLLLTSGAFALTGFALVGYDFRRLKRAGAKLDHQASPTSVFSAVR